MRNFGELKVFVCNSSSHLLPGICDRLMITPGDATIGRFAGGEVKIKINESVRDDDIFVVCSMQPPAENIVEAMLLTRAIKGSSASRVTLVILHLGYNRQDKKNEPRVPISASWILDLILSSGANRALFFDAHSEATLGKLDGQMPYDHLYGSYVIVDHLKKVLGEPFVIASPDAGGAKRAGAYSRRLRGNDEIVMFGKSRTPDGELDGTVTIIGDVAERTVVIVDDMIDTGGTLIQCAHAAKNAGAQKIIACATHGLFSDNAIVRLRESKLSEIIVTDSISLPYSICSTDELTVTVISIERMIARAINNLHKSESLSVLFD